MKNAEKLAKVLEGRNVNTYSWMKFNGLDFSIRDGVEAFWEPGHDYTNPDFWACYPEEETTEDFIAAVLMYDWLKVQ